MIIEDMPFADYLKHPALNSSKLKLMRKTPLDFKIGSDIESESTRSTTLGSAVHALLLEPKTFDSRYALQTENFGNKTKGKKDEPDSPKQKWERFQRENTGKTVLDKKQADTILGIQEKVRQNARLRFILASGRSEVTGIVKAENLELKARADLLCKEAIWDVKTTAGGMSDADLYREIKKYGYEFQAAHYIYVFSRILNLNLNALKFCWAFIDTDSPAHHIRLLECPRKMLDHAFFEHGKVLGDVTRCMQMNVWEGYPQDCRELEMPYWAEELK